MSMKKIFEEFDSADPAEGGDGKNPTITEAGKHKIKIQRIRLKESEQYDAVYYLVDFEVIETNADGVAVGASHCWAHNLTNKWFGVSNAKQFLAAVLGMSASSPEARAIDRSTLEQSYADDQPLAGQVLSLATIPKVSKTGNDFTVHNWSPSA